MTWVKVCGITNPADGLAAMRLGADAVGFVFAPSPRRVTPERARQIRQALWGEVKVVGVFVNAELELVHQVREFCGLDLVQLHGDEDQAYVQALGGPVIKSLAVGRGNGIDASRYEDALVLLDTHMPGQRGGTGKSFDWDLAVPLARERKVILAGGLGPQNVGRAIELVQPYGVDISSGIESKPGRKDHGAMADFIAQAKGHANGA